MQKEGMEPNKVTLINVLTAYSTSADLPEAKLVHANIVESGRETDLVLATALIHMYRCAHHGCSKEAVTLFVQLQKEGLNPNEVTFISLLNACSALADVKLIHAHIAENGLELNVIIGNALIDLYAKCGSIENAKQVFHNMPERNLISWTAMISGLSQHGFSREALELFYLMQNEGLEPNQITCSTVLNVCASLSALDQGKDIHSYVIKYGLESDVCVGAALIDMYAKCGSIENAWRVFNKIPKQDVVSWTSMIAACAQHGYGKEALDLFKQMPVEDIKPDSFAFNSILTACSHAGLVKEGFEIFNLMHQKYQIIPTLEHYVSMVDLLGRAGHLIEAECLINKMPFRPAAMVWVSLLSACRNHANVEVGEHALKHILELEPANAGAYVLLGNIYGASGRWDEQSKLRKLMKDRGVKTGSDCSWIEFDNMVNYFVAGDTSCLQTDKIYAKLENFD